MAAERHLKNILALDKYYAESTPIKLDEFIHELLRSVPEPYMNSATVELISSDNIEVHYQRPETDDEYTERIRNETRTKKRVQGLEQAQDMALLKSLADKYPKLVELKVK